MPKESNVYVDITGLSHSTWAGVLKSAIDNGYKVMVVYVEPGLYSRSDAPLEGQIYDLSDKITEISPLPGFAVLAPKKAETMFVPLLGFNIGLEIGQIVLVIVILVILFFLLKLFKVNRKDWILFISSAVFALSLKMTLERWPF